MLCIKQQKMEQLADLAAEEPHIYLLLETNITSIF